MLLDASTPGNNLVDYVLQESSKVALQTYAHPLNDPEAGRGTTGWLGLLNQRSVRFSNEQFAVFRAVHAWRDKKARDTDEGIQTILPNRFIWQIAESMPTSPYNFHQCCRGGSNKPVMDNVVELAEVVKKAKAEGKDGKLMLEFFAQQGGEPYGGSPAPRRPRHLTWRKEETTLSGVAATLQQLNAEKEVEAAVTSLNYDGPVEDPVATRSATSVFWGSIPPQYSQLPSGTATALTALASVLPLPSTSADLQEEEDGEVLEDAQVPGLQDLPNLATSGISQAKNEVFTLKDLSRSKKRKASDALSDNPPAIRTRSMNGNTASTPVSASVSSTPGTPISSSPTGLASATVPAYADLGNSHKQQLKAEKKARKAAVKAEAKAAIQEQPEPFDYANAASLINPSGVEQAKENGSKRMNPFAKALDTTTGAKRNKMGKEIAGKSMTFKS